MFRIDYQKEDMLMVMIVHPHEEMDVLMAQPGKIVRKDGEPEAAFKNAATIIDIFNFF